MLGLALKLESESESECALRVVDHEDEWAVVVFEQLWHWHWRWHAALDIRPLAFDIGDLCILASRMTFAFALRRYGVSYMVRENAIYFHISSQNNSKHSNSVSQMQIPDVSKNVQCTC